jgi:hypothetical protein
MCNIKKYHYQPLKINLLYVKKIVHLSINNYMAIITINIKCLTITLMRMRVQMAIIKLLES